MIKTAEQIVVEVLQKYAENEMDASYLTTPKGREDMRTPGTFRHFLGEQSAPALAVGGSLTGALGGALGAALVARLLKSHPVGSYVGAGALGGGLGGSILGITIPLLKRETDQEDAELKKNNAI